MKLTVKLRAMEPEDLEVLYEIENDTQTWAQGCTNVPYSRYVLHNYLASQSNDIYVDQQVRLMIADGEGRAVGTADLVSFDPQNRRAELGLMVLKQFRGQGFARQALEQLCEYALHTLHLRQLYAYIDSRNTPCVNMFKSYCPGQPVRLKDWLYDGKDYHDALLFQIFL